MQRVYMRLALLKLLWMHVQCSLYSFNIAVLALCQKILQQQLHRHVTTLIELMNAYMMPQSSVQRYFRSCST